VKVSELSGTDLDYWVAKAEGMQFTLRNGHPATSRSFDPEYHSNETDWKEFKSYFYFQPSRDWAHAGPIIEREKISIDTWQRHWEGKLDWAGSFSYPVPHPSDPKRSPSHHRMRGPTPLIAAMRTFVASRFGDEVLDVENPTTAAERQI
jgi:hypothetical protein